MSKPKGSTGRFISPEPVRYVVVVYYRSIITRSLQSSVSVILVLYNMFSGFFTSTYLRSVHVRHVMHRLMNLYIYYILYYRNYIHVTLIIECLPDDFRFK